MSSAAFASGLSANLQVITALKPIAGSRAEAELQISTRSWPPCRMARQARREPQESAERRPAMRWRRMALCLSWGALWRS
jgi:hypothetical protein